MTFRCEFSGGPAKVFQTYAHFIKILIHPYILISCDKAEIALIFTQLMIALVLIDFLKEDFLARLYL